MSNNYTAVLASCVGMNTPMCSVAFAFTFKAQTSGRLLHHGPARLLEGHDVPSGDR